MLRVFHGGLHLKVVSMIFFLGCLMFGSLGGLTWPVESFSRMVSFVQLSCLMIIPARIDGHSLLYNLEDGDRNVVEVSRSMSCSSTLVELMLLRTIAIPISK